MIKVLQITAALTEGGVETLLHTFYECVDKEKFHFDVACYSHADGVYRTLFEQQGCGILALPSKRKVLQSAKALYRALKEGQYDIVHVHQDDLSFLPILVARLAGVPVRIVHSHLGKYPHSLLGAISEKITNPIMFRLANGYFACSEKAKKEFYPARLQDRVYIMQNGIPEERFRFSPEERKAIREQYGFTENQTVIGNVARMTDQKDPLFLVDVFKQVHDEDPQSRLMLVGDGVMREAVQERIRALGLTDAAVLAGSRNDAYRYYSALDVFALPSAYEGLGISFVEAQVNGLPSFASTAVPRETKISGLIEYLPTGDKNTGLWAKRILACGGRDGRKDATIIDDTFDIRVHARALEEEYIKLTEAYQR
jgi:glycosyltransferase involved in cell wall biosynthesis